MLPTDLFQRHVNIVRIKNSTSAVLEYSIPRRLWFCFRTPCMSVHLINTICLEFWQDPFERFWLCKISLSYCHMLDQKMRMYCIAILERVFLETFYGRWFFWQNTYSVWNLDSPFLLTCEKTYKNLAHVSRALCAWILAHNIRKFSSTILVC